MIAGSEPFQICDVTIEFKHFFSGAAFYANGKICASLSPAGFAVKLSEDRRRELICTGKGEVFRFSPNGPVRRDYAAISKSVIQDEKELHELVDVSIRNVLRLSN